MHYSRMTALALAAGTSVLLGALAEGHATGQPLEASGSRTTTIVSGTVSATPARLGRHVAVYFEDAPRVAGRGMRATIDQHNLEFVPFLTIVTPGANVTFVNSDPFPHNVFSPDPKQFNLGLMRPGAHVSHVFELVGKHTLLCNIHPNMLAYVLVVPSSYYAVADAHGNYVIRGVPNGTYRLVAWAPKLRGAVRRVTLSGGSLRVDFHLHR